MKIKIGLSTPRSKAPLSWLIKKLNKVSYSHGIISYTSESGSEMVLESKLSGVRLMRANYYLPSQEIVHQFEVTCCDSKRRELLKFSEKHMGKPYGYGQLIGLGLMLFLNLFGFKLEKNPIQGKRDGILCNELVAMFCIDVLDENIEEDLDNIDLRWMERKLNEMSKKGKLRRLF